MSALIKSGRFGRRIDELAILTAALTAVLERRTTFVSPTAFEFISTTPRSATFASS